MDTKYVLKKLAVGLGMACALSVSSSAMATTVTMTYEGWLTLYNVLNGTAIGNTDEATNPYFGFRSSISGTIVYDTVTQSAQVSDFSTTILGVPITVHDVSFHGVGNGGVPGAPSTLAVSTMLFDVGVSPDNQPGHTVGDISGLVQAGLDGYTPGEVIQGVGANSITDSFPPLFPLPGWALGPTPIASAGYVVTQSLIDGTLIGDGTPLTANTVPGPGGPFVIGPGMSAGVAVLGQTLLNLDVVKMTVQTVPVPAALPLLLSGIVGLGVIGRRRRLA